MNFKKLHISKKPVLVNFDTVCEIHEISDGAALYFNTLTAGEEQALIYVDETIKDIEEILSL